MNTRLEPDARACIHELFEQQAARRPDAVAVTHGGLEVSYRDLDQRANALAHRLRELGVGPDSLVAVCVQRSAEAIIALLGVLKAGGAYLPLDPDHPDDRLAFICRHSGATLLITDQPARTLAMPRSINLHETVRAKAGAPSGVGVRPDNLAYVVYTSGSTGTPKGVMVEHANVVALLGSTSARFGFDSDDTWTLFASLAFDVSVWEMWGALLHGARLVVVPNEIRRSPGEFYALLRRERVTVVNLTPAAFRQLSRYDEEFDPPAAPALRWIIFAGESLTPGMLRHWLTRHGDDGPALVNMYGITETTVHSTWRRMTAADLAEPESSLIGLPLENWTAVVLDADGAPVAPGEPGELYVGGAGVARGYLGLPELTDSRFLPDPSGPEGARLYRSGDRCIVRPDGELQYLGRLDHQVKLRGYRIELGEIESALRSHPGIHEAVVVLDSTRAAEPRLVAYLVSRRPDAPAPEELRACLSRTLPDYMLPATFVTLDRLPLTSNGKVDVAALPAPGSERPALSVPLVQPHTPIQIQLARIWAEVLGVDEVGLDDDFFELGGHSMLAVRVIALAHEQCGLEISLRSVFDAPTVRLLAEQFDIPSAPQAREAVIPQCRSTERRDESISADVEAQL